MTNDITIIKRLVNGKERDVFYVDVGTLPPEEAEKFVRDAIQKHKENLK